MLFRSIYKWFRKLSERLRYVRVVCGDWTRVCGGNWQDNIGTVGIFFDPPYSVENRNQNLYHQESVTIANDVRKWCIERGNKSSYRIVLAGYDEHDELEKCEWTKHHWKTSGGYSKIGKKENMNRFRETLWMSPHCIKTELF